MAEDTDLLITLRLDKSFADTVSKAYHSEERKRIDETAKAQDKADQDYIRAMKLKARAVNDLAGEIERRAKGQEREQQRADDDYVRSVRTKLRAEQQLASEKEREIQKAAREQDKADQAYLRAVRQKLQAEKELEDQQTRGTEAANAQTVAVLKMVAGLAGLNGASTALSTIVDHFDKIRVDAFHAAEDVMRMRGAVRELAALRDEMGKTGGTMAHVMEGASKTL
jgi:hypothetical protein